MRLNKKTLVFPDASLLTDKALDDESAALAHVAHGLGRLLEIYHEVLREAAEAKKDLHPKSAATIGQKCYPFLNGVVAIQRFTDQFVYEAHQRCLKARTT